MAKNTIAYYPKEGKLISTTITGTTPVTIFTPGTEGAKVSKIYISKVTSTPTAVTVYVNNGVSDEEIIYLSTTPVDGTDLLALVPLDGGFNLESGSILKASTTVADTIQVVVYAENY
jgi:hypothetical protein